MSAAWIKMRNNLWDDPRIAKLCDLTGEGEAPIIGALYWLWSSADKHTADGVMPGLSLSSIDRRCGVKGFAAALVQTGWIVEKDDGIELFKYDEHNGSSAKRRGLDAQRKGSFRKVSASDADEVRTDCGQDADDLRSDCGGSAELDKSKIKEDQELLSATEAADDSKVDNEKREAVKRTKPPIPYQAIVAEYHRALPMLTGVSVLTEARKHKVKTLWHKYKRMASVDGWAAYFDHVATSDFLTGRDGEWAACDFEWLIKPENFVKVAEGKYKNRVNKNV